MKKDRFPAKEAGAQKRMQEGGMAENGAGVATGDFRAQSLWEGPEWRSGGDCEKEGCPSAPDRWPSGSQGSS